MQRSRGTILATIYDVAREAGVSPKTVSRVLNGDAPVNERTRRAVEDAIARLSYVPSSAARSMRSNRTGLIGLVTGAISTSPQAIEPAGLPELFIVQGVQSVLADNDITLLISDTGGRAKRVPSLVRTLIEHRVEGLIYVADHHRQVELPGDLGNRHIVLVNCFDDTGTPSVLPDDVGGQQALVAALIAHGHQRIGFLTLPSSLVAQACRLEGYRRALEAASIAYDPALVIPVDSDGTGDDLVEAIDQLVTSADPPSVICCGNDKMAVRVYGILGLRGITVPDAMSIAGYDDYRIISETLYPPLTTAELPYWAMGAKAATLLLDLMQTKSAPAAQQPCLVGGAVRWRLSVTDRTNETKPLDQAQGRLES